jgi:hypothetical protein
MKYEVTVYVDACGDLACGSCNEVLRKPTTDERRESLEEVTQTGLIIATVAERTLRQRCRCQGPWRT